MSNFKMFENSSDGVVVCNAFGKIIFWSPSLENITGLKKAEVLDKKFWHIQEKLNFQVNQDDFNNKIKSCWKSNDIKKMIHSFEGKHQEFLIKKADGLVINAEQYFYLVDELDTKFYLISFIRDISDKKKKFEAQKNYMRILNHDIRSPLTSIIGFSKLLQEDEISPENVKKFSSIINSVGESMLKMAQDYLLLEKIENGSNDIEKDQYTIFEIIDLVKRIILDLKLSNRIDFWFGNSFNSYFNTDLAQKMILINKSLFESAINNLIKNGAEASFKKEDKILISINEEDNKFCINISNQGEIPKEIQNKLFQKFNTSKSLGTGLGLYSAKLIIEAHGGELTYKSLPGTTVFMLKMPFSE